MSETSTITAVPQGRRAEGRLMTLITTVVSHRSVEIQTDPLAPPLLVTRAALIAASRRAQASESGLGRVSGRFPHLGAGFVELDEGQISELIEDLNRAAS